MNVSDCAIFRLGIDGDFPAGNTYDTSTFLTGGLYFNSECSADGGEGQQRWETDWSDRTWYRIDYAVYACAGHSKGRIESNFYRVDSYGNLHLVSTDRKTIPLAVAPPATATPTTTPTPTPTRPAHETCTDEDKNEINPDRSLTHLVSEFGIGLRPVMRKNDCADLRVNVQRGRMGNTGIYIANVKTSGALAVDQQCTNDDDSIGPLRADQQENFGIPVYSCNLGAYDASGHIILTLIKGTTLRMRQQIDTIVLPEESTDDSELGTTTSSLNRVCSSLNAISSRDAELRDSNGGSHYVRATILEGFITAESFLDFGRKASRGSDLASRRQRPGGGRWQKLFMFGHVIIDTLPGIIKENTVQVGCAFGMVEGLSSRAGTIQISSQLNRTDEDLQVNGRSRLVFCDNNLDSSGRVCQSVSDLIFYNRVQDANFQIRGIHRHVGHTGIDFEVNVSGRYRR